MSDWTPFALPDDLARERYTALLAALEELSTRGPMSTLSSILERVRAVGFHDPLTEDDLRDSLDQLARWGFTEPFRDYAAPVRNYQGMIQRQEAWALSRRGRTVVEAVRKAVLNVDRPLQLPARLLDSVEHTLRVLIAHATGTDERHLLPGDLDDITTRITEMQTVTADFYTALGRLVQSDVTNDELFGENRDRVIEALRQFPREYERAVQRVFLALQDLRGLGHEHLVTLAVEHAGLLATSAQQGWITERVRLLADLEAWFTHSGTVQRLIDSAAGAVSTLLNAIDRRYSARLRGVDLGADFRTLARSLHQQPHEHAARQVYAAAFGDWTSWHAATGPASEDVAYSTPAAHGAPRRTVEVTLREHERHGSSGGPPYKIADTTTARATALADAAERAKTRRAYAALLATDQEVGLDHFADLPHDALVVLLKAVEVAYGQLDPTTRIGSCDADGAGVRVTVRDLGAGHMISIRFPQGTLHSPDIRVQVHSLVSSTSSAEGVKSGAVPADRVAGAA